MVLRSVLLQYVHYTEHFSVILFQRPVCSFSKFFSHMLEVVQKCPGRVQAYSYTGVL